MQLAPFGHAVWTVLLSYFLRGDYSISTKGARGACNFFIVWVARRWAKTEAGRNMLWLRPDDKSIC